MAASRSRSPNQAQRLFCSKCNKLTDHQSKPSLPPRKIFGILRRAHVCGVCGTKIETVQMPSSEWTKAVVERDALKKKAHQLEELVQLVRDNNAAIEQELAKLK